MARQEETGEVPGVLQEAKARGDDPLRAVMGVLLQRLLEAEMTAHLGATAHEGIRCFVTESLYADGASRDLKRRDTLTYHVSSLRPPLQLAMLAGKKGRDLNAWESKAGGSLKKSVDYVVPYAMGEKTRREWTNSEVDLDRRRAEAGLDEYKPGRLYEPRRALKLMELASYFDPALLKVVLHLTGSNAKRYPTWQTLVNGACGRAGSK